MPEENPLVSILMTAYNREKYIAAAIESVLNSTYTNFELIITDDLSKDNTLKIANHYASNDARIKVFVNQQNLGDYPNRNKAATYATGKYLKYVDADDLIYPWGLQILVSCMEKNPTAGWGFCSLVQSAEQPYPLFIPQKDIYRHHYFKASIFHKAPLSSIIKKDLFDKVGGFMPYRMVGDNEMWHRLALNENLLLMPDGIVWYREHEAQEVNSKMNYEHYYIAIKKFYLNLIEKNGLSNQDIIQIQKIEKKRNWKNYLRSIVKLDFDYLFQEIKYLKMAKLVLKQGLPNTIV